MKIKTKKLAFWLLMIVIAAGTCELGARIVFSYFVGPKVLFFGAGAYRTDVKTLPSVVMAQVGYTPPTPGSYQFSSSDKSYTKFSPNEHKTDRDENGNRFHPTINSRGFRGKEFSEKKEPGVIRVITLGASSTFGYHDRDDETYPHYMEVVLNAASKRNKRFEVINLGLPHMGSEEILQIFLNEALLLQPDIVTFYEGYNESGITSDFVGKENNLIRTAYLKSIISTLYIRVKDLSVILAFFDSMRHYVGEIDFTAEFIQDQAEKKTAIFLTNVIAIHNLCKTNGILFIVANQQSRSQLIEREHLKGITFAKEVDLVSDKLRQHRGLGRREVAFLVHSSLMSSLRAWSGESKVPFVDVIKALDGDRSVLLTYVHPNSKGNRIIAQEFSKEILQRLK